jgi:hypothetical protein
MQLGEKPGPPQAKPVLVIVPVGAVNLLIQEALGAALSPGGGSVPSPSASPLVLKRL